MICNANLLCRERKNMNLPGVVVDLPTLTDKDKEDLLQWGVKNKVDFVAASFVRKGADLDNIRQVLGEEGAAVHIISKIENQEGIQNFETILQKSDGIMVRSCACARRNSCINMLRTRSQGDQQRCKAYIYVSFASGSAACYPSGKLHASRGGFARIWTAGHLLNHSHGVWCPCMNCCKDAIIAAV